MGMVVELPRSRRACLTLLQDPDNFEEVFEQEVMALREEQDGGQVAAGLASLGTTCQMGEACEAALRRRIEEVRSEERPRELSELMQMHAAHRLRELDMPLLSAPPTDGSAAEWEPVDPKRLVAGLYSEEAMRLVGDHVMDLIGEWSHLVRDFPLQLSIFEAGQVYAVSALFGYALRRADHRFRLERLATGGAAAAGAATSLGEYVAAFGPEEAREVATIASQEAQFALERRVSALFGDLGEHREDVVRALEAPLPPGAGATAVGAERSRRRRKGRDEVAKEKLRQAIETGAVASARVTVGDLRRLALEGCAFGRLLGDAEAQVDSSCELTPGTGRGPVVSAGVVDEGLKFSAFRIFGA